ncbi:hypothetical protein CC77DRAFT_1025665 [Alternaria alternata]|uniref:Uncharacterized protein n=1 Tax=Alternaria alternata TaxID=5599 RepID=A0A177D469_ALTAL|nr:hypothetical protein CC77DRAFT_1025665 [Alternaria alternata]OAG14495.1 hypothetical protein CC77DRAFT_1025665 [Alternaria alternata]
MHHTIGRLHTSSGIRRDRDLYEDGYLSLGHGVCLPTRLRTGTFVRLRCSKPRKTLLDFTNKGSR